MASIWAPFTGAKTTTPNPASTEIPDFFGTAKPDSPEKILRLAKIPGVDPAIFQQYGDTSKLHDVTTGSTEDFLKALTATNPQRADYNAGDISEINTIFNPSGYQASLSGIRDRHAAALDNLNSILFGDIRRGLSQGRIGGGGMGGLSSYLAKLAADQAGRIRAGAAVDRAGQERTDIGALMAARLAALGKRAGIIDADNLNALAPIGAVSNANSVYANAVQNAIQNALLNSMIGVGAEVPGAT